MPGDATSERDDELLSQIDELRARMDRLMKGGSATSNSAVLGDGSPRARQVGPPESARPAVPRSRMGGARVRADDTELLESYRHPEGVVPFPNAGASIPDLSPPRPAAAPSRPGPPDAGRDEIRPRANSFDDLQAVIKEELARDDSVPPEEPERPGPELASRFGDDVTVLVDDPPASPLEAAVAEVIEDDPPVEEVIQDGDRAGEAAGLDEPIAPRSFDARKRTLVAVWGTATSASIVIAGLRFLGVI